MNKKILKINEISHNAHNIVEEQLRAALKKVVENNPNWGWEQISLQDVYACAINRLPAKYKKKGESKNENLPEGEIEKAIKFAMYKISQNPIHFQLQSSTKK